MVVEVDIFDFLDVRNANALVLYRLYINNESTNIANSKLRLVRSLVGKQIKAAP